MSLKLTSKLTFPLGTYPNADIFAVADNVNGQIQITVENVGIYDNLQVFRIPGANPLDPGVPVRGADNIALTGSVEFILFDVEAPLDSPFYYRAVLDGTSQVQTLTTVQIDTDGRTFWIKDVILGASSSKVQVESMSDVVTPTRQLAVLNVIGRANPIIITDVRQGRTGTLTLTSQTSDDITQIRNLFASGNVLLFQCPLAANFPDMYFVPGDVTESWNGGYASNTVHSFSFPFIEADGPSTSAFVSNGNSWLLVTQFDNWADVAASRSTWEQVLISPFNSND